MKYVVMCAQDRGGEWPELVTVEYSGTEHKDREAARKEMMSIGRRMRELHDILTVWIREVDE